MILELRGLRVPPSSAGSYAPEVSTRTAVAQRYTARAPHCNARGDGAITARQLRNPSAELHTYLRDCTQKRRLELPATVLCSQT